MSDWKTVESDGLPPCDGHTTYIGINSAGYACCFNAMRGGLCVMETAEGNYRQMSDLRDWRLLGRPARGVKVDAPAHPLNGIAATVFHGEGAIARCSYCGRYSLDRKTLGEDRYQPVCECGQKHGWSGSFKRPGPDAKWSGKAPAGVQEGGNG